MSDTRHLDLDERIFAREHYATILATPPHFNCGILAGKLILRSSLVSSPVLVKMSLLDIGPIAFGGNEAIISYLRSHGVLARSCDCVRYFYLGVIVFMNHTLYTLH